MPRAPIRERLLEYYTEEEADLWLSSPQPLLGGAIGNDLIAAGEASSRV